MVADKSLGVGLRQSFGMLATSEPFEHRRAFLPGARLPIKRDGRAQEPAQLVLLVSRQRRQDAEKTFGEDWHSCARVWHIAVCLCQADLAKGSGSFFSYGLHKTIVMRAIGLPLFSRLRAKRKEFTSRFADRKAALRIGQAQNSRRRAGGNLDRAQEHARQIIWRVLHVVFRGEHFRDVLAASCCADARRCHWLTPVPAAGVASSAPPNS